MEEINFKEEITNHIIWNVRLRCFLDGGECISEDKIVSYRNCCLGRWIYSHGFDKYSSISYMKELEEVHRNLHDVVRRVIQLKNSGNKAFAEAEMEKLRFLSNRIIYLILKTEEEVNALRENNVLEK